MVLDSWVVLAVQRDRASTPALCIRIHVRSNALVVVPGVHRRLHFRPRRRDEVVRERLAVQLVQRDCVGHARARGGVVDGSDVVSRVYCPLASAASISCASVVKIRSLQRREPVIAQLATVIDDLASYLNTNPTAADKARDILDTAKVDLTQLATRIDEVRETERKKLEASLDEQARECMQSLMELEMQAQDKLDSQEENFRKFFEQERAKLIREYRQKLDHELQTQSEIINERLRNEVIAQGIELQRRWIREIKVRVEQERGGRLAKLDEIATNLKRLERVALDNSALLDENIRIHALWSAIRAVHHAVDAPERKPFREELRALRRVAAAREDPRRCCRARDDREVGGSPIVALVPDQNAGVLSYLASNLFSYFRFQRHGLVEGSDVLSVLARAEYYLNEKDLDSAARELNQLKGPAKVLLSDWLDAARRRLEVLQALEVVEAEATLASLLVAQD
ncbi:hypothetical protein NUW54_g2008 [Trametes sanguinea]|uniref:Uncharacterized protein n=1 Tax=Trametes sanguinea TaxID=158606 RepID=A0ACC1Q6J7_9APHY|nr:hypothetical protein NUW54_g2008 [Trametes sanguinea]